MKPGYTMEQFALVMAAIAEGFTLQAIQGSTHPIVKVPDEFGVPQEWTLFGRAVMALVAEFMESAGPDAASDDR